MQKNIHKTLTFLWNFRLLIHNLINKDKLRTYNLRVKNLTNTEINIL